MIRLAVTSSPRPPSSSTPSSRLRARQSRSSRLPREFRNSTPAPCPSTTLRKRSGTFAACAARRRGRALRKDARSARIAALDGAGIGVGVADGAGRRSDVGTGAPGVAAFGDARTRVARVAEPVAVGVRLVRIGHGRAVVAEVPDVVADGVLLAGLERQGTVVGEPFPSRLWIEERLLEAPVLVEVAKDGALEMELAIRCEHRREEDQALRDEVH